MPPYNCKPVEGGKEPINKKYLFFVCKTIYYECILNEFGIDSTFDHSAYIPAALTKD
jgi:hypothetical protein